MNIGFTGHQDRLALPQTLHLLNRFFTPDDKWLHGGAKGFDTQIDDYAKELTKPILCAGQLIPSWIEYADLVKIIRPDYKLYADRPKYAPLARNIEIVDRSMVLITNYDGRQYGGTFFTVNKAKEKGISIIYLPSVPNPNFVAK